MKIMKILLVSALSLLTLAAYAEDSSSNDNTGKNSSPPPSPAVTSPDISGNYQCHGYDPFGKSNYANPVLITKHGDVFNFQWLNSKGNPFLLGTGVMHPEIKNMISVVFWDPKKPDYFGTEVFTIKQGGAMSATWTVQGEDQVGTEACIKNGPTGP